MEINDNDGDDDEDEDVDDDDELKACLEMALTFKAPKKSLSRRSSALLPAVLILGLFSENAG